VLTLILYKLWKNYSTPLQLKTSDLRGTTRSSYSLAPVAVVFYLTYLNPIATTGILTRWPRSPFMAISPKL
jgi:hypothetical protein